MTNRELFLLLTSVVFISTTVGLAFKVSCDRGHAFGHGGFGGKEFSDKGDWKHKDGKFGDKFRGGPDRMIKEADTNKDGQLTKDEMIAAHTQRMDKMFAELDTNKDGQLSKDELAKGHKKMREKMMKKFKDEDRADAPAPEQGPEQGGNTPPPPNE